MVREPGVFLMDEPLSNLDPRLRARTRAGLVALHRRLGATFVYVTHDPDEAMTMGDRVAVLVDGRIQQIDRPRDVYDHPENLAVARFLGAPAMNTLSASLEMAGGEAWVTTSTGSIPLVGRSPAETSPGVAVVVGFRADDAVLQPGRSEDGPSAGTGRAVGLAATVRFVEHQGTDDLVVCDAGGDEIVVCVRDGPGRLVRDGDRVVVQPGRVHLFDPATGRRIE
jgi:multiple sugar transport system ATP-binding protein